MRIIIFDFEVFKHDTLLGTRILEGEKDTLYQTWNLEEMRQFYKDNASSIWVGHNNIRYDNFILQSVVRGATSEGIKVTNDKIIKEDKRLYLEIPLISYDTMRSHFYALKTMEAYMGKNISESEVDFEIDRHLTDEEKRLTESYNRDDLSQTYDDFMLLKHEFLLRLDIIKEFGLSTSCLSITGTQVAEEVLGAQRVHGIERWVRKPVLWPTLRVKNKDVIEFYLSERWRDKGTLNLTLCGTPHTLAAGGIHGAKKQVHIEWAYYFDVSGYYNLIMIILDLLPRSIPAEGKEKYKNMYHEQLRLKKIDPGKRGVYKTILLSVFGAMNNPGCRFYDPYNGDLVRMSGQMYLVDLLEKCEGKLEAIQSNTDGVILIPINGTTEEEVMSIMKEWQERTGFVLKLDKIYNIHQRDVNTYLYRDAGGEIHVVGDIITHYGKLEYPFWKDSYNAKEPLIISEAIVEYFMNKRLPEDTIRSKSDQLRLFQYICKKASYDYLEYRETDESIDKTSLTRLQNVNRAFAMKNDSSVGMIYKCKNSGACARYQNLPDSVFVYNDEITSDEAVNSLMSRIDYQYYIDRTYEKIKTYYNFHGVSKIV